MSHEPRSTFDLAFATALCVLILTVLGACSRGKRSKKKRSPQAIEETFEEIFINPSASYTANATEATANGSSLLHLHALATPSECRTLLEEGTSAADEEFEAQTRPSAKYRETVPARVRMPVERILHTRELQLCDTLLRRALARLAKDAPQLCQRQMGPAINRCSRILGNRELIFSDGEPAINVYRAGGEFKPHEDKMSMTILVPLSDSASGAFTGGGTAFWSEIVSEPDRSRAQGRPPSFVVHALAGSALVFTGSVTHGAMPVLSGERAVFVASFGPLVCMNKAPSSSGARLVAAVRDLWSAVAARTRERETREAA